MKFFLFTIIVICLAYNVSSAQCSGIEITGFNADNPDQIRLRTTAAIPPGTIFYITDNEWSSANSNFVDLNENEEIFTVRAAGLDAGVSILLEGSNATVQADNSSAGTLTAVPALNAGTGSEQIYILSVVPSITANAVPANTICFAVQTSGTPAGDLPVGNSVNLGDFDNFRYVGPGNITDATNWEGSNNIINLPIELLKLSVSRNEKTTLISFATATEHNNDYFAIERSSDGRTFEQIGAIKGSGTTLTKQEYTFTDEKPLRGINYYRLKQVDFDGQFSYSPVISVQFGKVGNVVIYPTPATETVNVRLEENLATDAQWQIIDMTGRVMSEGVFAAEQLQYSLPVATLTQGAYVLRVTAEQEVLTQQFRKQ